MLLPASESDCFGFLKVSFFGCPESSLVCRIAVLRRCDEFLEYVFTLSFLQGVLSCRGKLILFADADGATRFSDLANLEKSLKDTAGDAVVIGSRAHLEDKALAEVCMTGYFQVTDGLK